MNGIQGYDFLIQISDLSEKIVFSEPIIGKLFRTQTHNINKDAIKEIIYTYMQDSLIFLETHSPFDT